MKEKSLYRVCLEMCEYKFMYQIVIYFKRILDIHVIGMQRFYNNHEYYFLSHSEYSNIIFEWHEKSMFDNRQEKDLIFNLLL